LSVAELEGDVNTGWLLGLDGEVARPRRDDLTIVIVVLVVLELLALDVVLDRRREGNATAGLPWFAAAAAAVAAGA